MRPTTMKVDGTVYWTIMTYDSSGILVDADATPIIDIRKNGSPILDVATSSKRAGQTGIYDYQYNPASEAEGDTFLFQESATVSGQTYVNSWSLEVKAAERGTDNASTFDHTTNQVITDAASRNASKADVSALATQASVDSIDADVQTIGSDVTTILADTDELQQNQGNWLTADVSALSTQASVDSLQVTADAILDDTNDLQTHQGDWITADVSGLATQASIDALNDFDPALDTVAHVTLVDTTTSLTNGGSDCPTAQEIVDTWGNQPQGVYTTPDTFGFYLDAQVSSAGSGGTGLYQATVRVQDSDSNALQGARVNVDGTTLTLTTDSSGEVTFNLDSGVYLLEVSPPAGYDTPVGQVLTITDSDPSDTVFTLASTTPPEGCNPPWIG